MCVLEMDAGPRREVHTCIPNGGKAFEELARRWSISDLTRLRDICTGIRGQGVESFEHESVNLTMQIEHAFANTWPDD